MSLINPKEAIEKKYISPINEKCIQQNGIDLRLDKANLVVGTAIITEEKSNRVFPSYYEMLPDESGFFHFKAGFGYVLDMIEYIKVPENAAAFIFTRSTLNRSASITTSGLYDSGFEGVVGVTLRPFVDISIKKETRICQVTFVSADSASLYKGQYQRQKSHKEMLNT